MLENKVNKLLADLIKKPIEANTFVEDADKYLSNIGLAVSDKEKTILKSIAEEWRKQGAFQINRGGGHTNLNTHTDYNDSDGHVDRDSHTNHTSSY